MKKAIIFLVSFLVASSLFAQQNGGDIFGKVVDGEGKALRGVSVTLTGSLTPPLKTRTNGKGTFRFLALFPGNDYVLKAEFLGYKAIVRESVVVAVGRSTDIVFRMEQGPSEETVAVATPVSMVEARKATVGLNMTRNMLQSLPSARDPWEIMQMAPGVILLQDNIGGIFTGQMADATSRAGSAVDDTWSLDGLVVSDTTSIGKPSTHWDFDSFEEMNITSGVGDVTRQTGGIQINVVSRKGGDKLSFGGRFHFIDSRFQADTFSETLASEGLAGINKFEALRDFGFNIGIPVVKDKIWLWGSYGVQDLEAFTVYGNPDNSLLTTAAAKLSVQIVPRNRLEFFAQGNRRVKVGSDQWYGNPEGTTERPISHFGAPVFRIQDDHTFGNSLSFSVRWGATNGGFEQVPTMDPDLEGLAVWDEEASRYYGSYRFYGIDKWSYHTSAQIVLFNEELFGAAHEFRLGFELSDRDNQKSKSGTPGNLLVTQNFITPQADFNEDGEPDVPTDPDFRRLYFERGYKASQGVKAWAAFFNDTISFGRFNLTLGLRYDYQHPLTKALTVYAVESDSPQWSGNYFTSDAVNKLAILLPYASVPGLSASASDGSKYAWKDIQPRLSLTYDLFGDGKTIAKLAFSRYSSWMGTGEASRWRQNATGWMGFYWWDTDQDAIVSAPELYWYTVADYALYPVFEDNAFAGDWEDAAGVFWGDFEYTNPGALDPLYYSIQPNAQSQHTDEVFLALEREILPDFDIQISATFRKYKDFAWDLKYFPETGVIQNPGWFEEAAPVPASIPELGSTGEAAGKPWYYVNADGAEYSPWYHRTLRPDYHENYWGVDVVFNKRLSNKWMLNGSFTFQDSSRRYGENGLFDQTNRWATEGNPSSPAFVNFMAKLSGLYQLPLDIMASFTYQGRQGWIVAETFRIVDYTLPNPLSNSAVLMMSPFGSERLPFVHKLNFRVEKMFKLGDTGRIFAMVDVFNVLNAATPTGRTEKFHGTYYIYEDPDLNAWVRNSSYDLLTQILNPRVVRVGVRFQF